VRVITPLLLDRSAVPAKVPPEGVRGIVRAARKVGVECRLLARRLLCLESCGPGLVLAAAYRTTRNPRCVAAGVTSTWVRSRVIEPPGPTQTR
jgi:hypothetical protein